MNNPATIPRLAIRGWLLAGFVLVLVVFLGLNVASYLSARRSTETAHWLRHTHEVLAQIQKLQTHAADAHAAMRGYVISGREDFLAPYHTGLRELPNDQRNLRQLTADNPRQQERLQRLDALIGEHLAFVQSTVELRRDRGMEAAVAQVSSGRGQKIMDQLRSLVGELEHEERSLLADREAQAGSANSKLFFILPIGTLIGLGLLLVVLFFLNAETAERQRTEAANRSFAAIVESTDDAVISKTLAGIVTSWNPGAERILGYTAREAIGQTVLRFFLPERAPEEADILDRIGRGERIENFETVRLRKDGARVDASVTISPVKDASGRIIGASKILRDITARKRLELAVRESEERFRTMANSMSQLAWIARADGFIFWYNQRWYDYTGTTPEQMEGWGWQSVHDPAVLPEVMVNWTGAIAAGKPFEMEFPLRGADGQFRTFLTRSQPLKDSEGRVVQWFGTNTDVEALKQAQENLRQSEEFNRRIIESSSDCIKVLDLEARLLSMSEGGQRLLEIQDINRYLHSCWISFWNPGDQLRVREAVEAARAGGMGRFQAFCPSEAGNPRWWDVIVTPIRGASGQVDRLLSISRDISVQNEAEEKIRQLNAELEQRVHERTAQLETANHELEAFSYSVSHDLRAPLRAVDGFSQAVLEDFGPQLPEEGQRQLRTVRESAQRMGMLIDDLLAFSRLSRASLKKQLVDMGQLVRETIEDLRTEREGRQIDIRIGELPPCSCDAALLRQAWINLLSNAFKYSRNRDVAMVEIGWERTPEGGTYFVRDNGTGFDMRYVGKLFGVFQRLHRAEDYEGTGVGLALVQRIIHRHGGKVWADAAVDRGATFYFTLTPNTKP